MNSWNLILATVVIFGTGVITGGMLVEHVVQPHPRFNHRGPMMMSPTNRPPEARTEDLFNPRQPEMLSQDFVQKLDDQLLFAPDQRDAIHKIIASGQDQNHALWTNWVGQSRQVLTEVRQHIHEELTPDQRKTFEKMLKQMRPPNRRPGGPGTNAANALPPTTNATAVLSTNTAGK